MELNVHEENGTLHIKITGRLDTTNSQQFTDQVEPRVSVGKPDVAIDCAEMEYISSSGLRSLLSLQKRIAAGNGKLVLRGMQPHVREILDMTGFSKIFVIE